MDLSYSPEYEAFRTEIRAFAKQHGARAPRGMAASMDGARAWQKLLIEHGYAARTIPKDYGGYGGPAPGPEMRVLPEGISPGGPTHGQFGPGTFHLWAAPARKGDRKQKGEIN